jgi:hypothetical protein
VHFLPTLWLASLVLAAPSLVSAQQTVNDASLSGRVTDATGGAVAGAHLTARHLHTNVTVAALADEAGHFRFPALRIGPYELAVTHPGFAAATRPITLSAGSAFSLPIVLVVDGVITDVTVVADAPLLEAARSQLAVTVSESEVRQLPLNGRNFP